MDEKHLPDVLKVPKKKELLDWKKIDGELSVIAEKACQEIYSSIPLKRVSITEIIRRLGYKKWLEKREVKLPKTNQIIEANLESLEEYMLRKLHFVERKFIEVKIMPTRNQLTRRARIENYTSKNSVKIQTEIQLSLAKIKKEL